MEQLDINVDGYVAGSGSDSDATVVPSPPSRCSSTRSNPFDIELPDDFTPRSLEWFLSPRPDPKKPINMFWTDPAGYYASPSPSPTTEKDEDQPDLGNEKLGTMGSLEQWFVPRRRDTTYKSKWTIGALLPDLVIRRVSLNVSDISQFQLARPPTPPRKRSRYPDTMSNKPLPPLPQARRFVSEGNTPFLAARPRSRSIPEFALSRWSESSKFENAAEDQTQPITDSHIEAPKSEIQAPETMNSEYVVQNTLSTGSHLLVCLNQYQENQMAAVTQVENTLSNPHIPEALREKFIGWSQQLIDLDCPFRVNAQPGVLDVVKVTEKDAHHVVDWAIEVGTKTNTIHDQINTYMDAADSIACELREMSSGVDIYNGSLLPIEELYHNMADIVRKKCRSPRLHEVLLLRNFLNLYENLLYIPFQNVKDRVKIVHDTYPHNPVSIALNIDTPLSLLKRVLDAAYIAHAEYTALIRRIRREFFVPIEERIPGVSSRTDGYLNNVVGPTNVI
ncbi:hypothetical protein EYB25_005363 [Talaromyces marneffei]|uniref:Uncharacterized protein n=3 Tax=Talaromyces marneffei TaxID=37727 RepID=B6QK47_TALMQ|nr:hypothetical protein PMAA_092040 [Talaromyces marneffei ATCC 18224]KAE8551473.1 hypothetical protein EYB25_005363 [Talaromyces marneffei]